MWQTRSAHVPTIACPSHGAPCRSPGHDGLPAELYRKFQGLLAPLLARLFTTVTELGILPARFHEGLITVIYKSSDRSEPTNYRPITLLCTDYRLFTKCWPCGSIPAWTASLTGSRLPLCLAGILGRT